jgi:hypothetical protein
VHDERFYYKGRNKVLYPKWVTSKYTVYPLASLNLTNKRQKSISKDRVATTIFLIIVVAVSAMTIGMAPLNTATADNGRSDDLRFIWRTTESQTEQRDFVNRNLDSGDFIVVHYPHGGDPTSEQISALKAVTSVPNSRKGLEFFSLAEIKEHAITVKRAGLGFIAYDIESISPSNDLQDPVRSVRLAKQYASAAGVQLAITPSQLLARQYGTQFAPYVDRMFIQTQIHQDNDQDCEYMRNWINTRITEIERARPSLAGKIGGQVTLSNYPAEGKTAYQTAQDCLEAVSDGNSKVDGMGWWWNPAQWNDGDVQRLVQYYESNHS